MKLGFIMERALNSNYRVLIPMTGLERRGHTIVWPRDANHDVPIGALSDCDLVHCFRRLDRFGDLKQLAARGVAISFDNDDDLSATDISSEGGNSRQIVRGARGQLENMKKFSNILKIASFAHLATTPSKVLAEKYRDAGATNVRVLENYIDDHVKSIGSRSKHAGVVVGWVASKEHEMDLPHLSITNALRDLLDRYPDLRIVTVGSRLRLDSPRYEFRKSMPFDELALFAAGIDIGIAPLADTQFNRARSNVKLKEYAAGGACWLASPVGAYVSMGMRQGGRLVTDDNWQQALDLLIGSRFTRGRLSRQAMRWAKTQTIDANISTWEDAFLDAVQRAQTRRRGEP
jgi:hypothetical protein